MVDKQINIRIIEFIEYKEISQSKFSKIAGLSNSLITHVKKGGVLGIDKVYNILDAFNELNPEWLLFGTGSMLLSGEEVEKKEIQKKEIVIEKKEVVENKNALAEYLEKELKEYKDEVKKLQRELSQAKEFIAQQQGLSDFEKFRSKTA